VCFGRETGRTSEDKEQIMQQRGIVNRVAAVVGACLAACASPVVSAQTYLMDFGPSSTPTASPDTNGNQWNNFSPGNFIRVADTAGAFSSSAIAAGIGFGLTTGSGVSVLPDEGLLSPDPSLLAELAIETATQDHMFNLDIGGTTLGGEFSSVDPAVSFTFSFLCTRAGVEGETGIAITDASGTSSQSVVHTSNADTLVVFEGVQAQANGTIQFELSAASGDFMFINALKIEVEGGDGGSGCDFASNTAFFIDTGPQFISGQPATTGTDGNGNQWNNFRPGQFIRVLDSDGQVQASTIPDGIGFGATTGLGSSLLPDEGLLAPDANLLCDLAIESATQDHLFVFDFDGSATLGLEFSSVDPTVSFTMSLLSTRNGVPGETTFELTDASGTRSQTVEHTSNADTLVVFEGVQSNADDGTIQLVLSAASGEFMFLNAIKLEIEGGVDPNCNAADLAEPFGILDLADINAFVIAFTTQDPAGDIDNNGIFDLSDITAFVGAFTTGCP
jgi:hypothetical protein